MNEAGGGVASERWFALGPIYARPECGKSSSHVIGTLATQANQSLAHTVDTKGRKRVTNEKRGKKRYNQ